MSESPSKRRKISPISSIATNASVLQNQQVPTLSFASPTRASTARRNAQLTSHGLSPGNGLNESVSKGTNLNDHFAKALAETTMGEGTTVETPRTSRSIGGSFSTKPRRMSRSPIKSTTNVERAIGPPLDLESIANPFQKKGLRRSPISSQVNTARMDSQPVEEEYINPFKKKGLRRSPVLAQPLQLLQQGNGEDGAAVRFTTTPPGPPPSRVVKDNSRRTEDSPTQKTVSKDTNLAPVAPVLEETNTRIVVPADIGAPPVVEVPEVDTSTLGRPAFTRNKSPETQETTDRPLNNEKPESKPLSEHATVSHAQPPKTLKSKLASTLTKTSAPDPESSFAKPPARTTDKSEPDLPPTPTQRGLIDPVVTTPPKGIHNTPSKRERARRGKLLKSSPLKPRDERSEEARKEAATAIPVTKASLADTAVLQAWSLKAKALPKRRKSTRFWIPEDPYAEKKKERDALLEKLQQLQEDIKLGSQETERLRAQHQQPKKTDRPVPPSTKDSEDLIAMLLRSTTKPPSIPASTAETIFNSIASFLPFRSRRKATNHLPITTIQALEKPLPSLLPHHQSDPLPFLQAFSPLNYSSTITLLPPSPSSTSTPSQSEPQPTLQHHLITATHPSALFLSRLSLTINPTTNTIDSLNLLNIDPASIPELQPFLQKKAEAKELSVIGWAMGRWAETAIMRARFWCAVGYELDGAEARSRSIRELKSKSKKRKRAGTAGLIGEEGEEGGDDKAKEKKWSKRELLPHMGRTSFEISCSSSAAGGDGDAVDGLVLRVEWNMEFDWTGEVKSLITARARTPGSWRAQDDRRSLVAIPITFQRLVKEKGPLDAVRSIVALLFAE